ncbi:hypothetical protein U1Q18_052553 [Sarracenia purpurea var. burkii]
MVDRSFLYFETENEAMTVLRNISTLVGDCFLKPHFIIPHDQKGYWLVVDKFDCSLESYMIDSQSIWFKPPNSNVQRLKPSFKTIIRNIITGIQDLHQQGLSHGGISSKTIFIVNGSAKLGWIKNEAVEDPSSAIDQDVIELRILFHKMLGYHGNNTELAHFFRHVQGSSK